MGSDKEASKAFEEALLHAQKNIESKQNSIDNVEGDFGRPVELTENISSDETSSSKLTSSSNIKRGDPLPTSPLFLMGLLLPIITAAVMISFISQTHADSVLHGPVYTPKYDANVVLNNVTYDVYEVTMSGGFSDHYPPDCHQNCWEFLVEVYTAEGDVEGTIWGYSVGPSLNSFEPYIENGNTWYMMDLRYCEGYVPEFDCDDDMFIKINTDGTVNIATNFGLPTFIEYSYISLDYHSNLLLRELSLTFWPISIVAGIIWGLKTDRKKLAYGLITGASLCIAIPVLGFIFAIFSGGLL